MFVILKDISLVDTKCGTLTLKVTGKDGSVKTLHSLYDPEAEANTLIESFKFDGKGILVVLGLGLGYHVAALQKKYPDAEIVVVEAIPEIFELVKEHGPPSVRNVSYIIGPYSSGSRIEDPGPDAGSAAVFTKHVMEEITRHQMKDGIKPLSIFTLSSAVSAFPQYYRPVLDSLKKTASVRLWDRLKYPKFRDSVHKILLIDSGYFLVREIEHTIRSGGDTVAKISITKNSANAAVIPQLIETVLSFKPDFVLTMNHLGFDEEGAMTSFLRSIEMPTASWYADSPNLIVKAFSKNVSPYSSLFLWDRSYMNDMSSMGFESVHYLPLATDTDIFRPVKDMKKIKKYACDIGFVGNSMVEPVDKWMSRCDDVYHPLIKKIAQKIASSRLQYTSALEEMDFEEKALMDMFTVKERSDFEAAVLWNATLLYRLSCIKMLDAPDMRIYGDKGWKGLLDSKKYRISPPLNYYRELHLSYNASKINFNATSLQMSEAVNQRVFDVPACGAFLLTDYQRSLDELFENGKEIITYSSKEEIPGLAKYYLDNPGEREEVVKRGRERVLREHTYKHRLDILMRTMKIRYK